MSTKKDIITKSISTNRLACSQGQPVFYFQEDDDLLDWIIPKMGEELLVNDRLGDIHFCSRRNKK
jgi:hypothetical protein